jgi:hypothetical protein
MFLRTKYFIVVEGYNPRIHALYFCPQLFRHDSGKLVPLEGEEIGRLIARAVDASASERRPWYEPMEKLPQEPLISSAMLREFDTLVVEMPARESLPAGGPQLLGPPSQPAEASWSAVETRVAEPLAKECVPLSYASLLGQVSPCLWAASIGAALLEGATCQAF